MAQNFKFNNLHDLDEVRKPKKCPIFDFGPLRESELYRDLISLGYMEVNAQGEPRLENETFQGERARTRVRSPESHESSKGGE